MNSFELRQSKRRDKRRKQREDRAFTATLEAVGVQSFFEEAFVQYYGILPQIVRRGGWFLLQGKRYSQEKFRRYAMELYAKIKEHEETP